MRNGTPNPIPTQGQDDLIHSASQDRQERKQETRQNLWTVGGIFPTADSTMDTSVRRAGSMRSIQSSWSLKRDQMLALMNKRSSLVELVKLAAITFLPLSVVFGLCIKSLLNADQDIKAANSIHNSVDRSQDIGRLVSALLNERGIRCQYLAVDDQDASTSLSNDLLNAENKTNQLLEQLSSTLPESFSNFTDELDHFRSVSRGRQWDISCSDVLSWYTFYTRKLEEECSRPFSAGAVNSFWSAYFAYNALLVAQDMIGLQRALGSNYFGDGNLSPRNYVYFAKNVGGADAIIQQVTSVLYDSAASLYSNLTRSNDMLMNELQADVDIILNQSLNGSVQTVSQNPDQYFNVVTDYMKIVQTVEDFIQDRMLADADAAKRSRTIEFQIILILVVLVLIVSPAFTTWYAYQSRKMMQKIGDFTDRLKEQKSQLEVERKKAELLLCQMLPKSIVMDMAQNKTVMPESFDEATVFFSRIDDFAAFVMRSEPFQVVDLLNHLYRRCDDVLDQYDAYKVETIGDSYLIVSGVPRRNGRQHSAEIATIALHFLMMMESFQVPTLIDETVKLTVGIHTGQVVAGVMGVKQQRYCLFGDTVNIASRMMTSGIASRIHLSSVTTAHLHTYHPGQFRTKLRGGTNIKGKGTLITHWLLGRKQFPFSVQMEPIGERSMWADFRRCATGALDPTQLDV